MKVGDVFNPWRGACGFYAPDVVSRLRPFTILETRRKFSTGHKLLYTRLVRRAGRNGRCFPGQADLAEAVGKSERAVRMWLEDLEAFGLIARRCRGRGKKGAGQTAEYTFLWHALFDRQNPPILTGRNGHYDRQESALMTGKNEQIPYKEETCTEETRTGNMPLDVANSFPEIDPKAEGVRAGKPTDRQPVGGHATAPAGYAFDEQFIEYRAACIDWGMNVVDPEDFYEAFRWEWSKLDFFQRGTAIDNIRARFAAGLDPLGWKPKNFLKAEYKRPIKIPEFRKRAATAEYQSAEDYLRRVENE